MSTAQVDRRGAHPSMLENCGVAGRGVRQLTAAFVPAAQPKEERRIARKQLPCLAIDLLLALPVAAGAQRLPQVEVGVQLEIRSAPALGDASLQKVDRLRQGFGKEQIRRP